MSIKTKVTLEFTSNITLTEDEARALDALAGYGHKEFLNMFYKCLGQHYMKPYEKGLVGLFDRINKEIKPQLYEMDKVRKTLKEAGL